MNNGQNIFNLEVVFCHVQCKVLTEQLPAAHLRTRFLAYEAAINGYSVLNVWKTLCS
jgi:hypothetical protein